MSVQTETPPARRRARLSELQVSTYERAASMLISALLLLGMLVICLLIVWLTSTFFVTPKPVETVLQNVGGGREDGVVGESMQIDAPEAEEIAKEAELPDPQIQEQLQMIVDAVALKSANLTDPSLTEDVESGGGGKLTGDGRQVGKGKGSGPPGIPPEQRWEILYPEGATLNTYGRILDFFKIELGIISRTSNLVQYASKFSAAAAELRSGAGRDEKRLYMSWRSGPLRQADLQLLAKVGVPTENRLVVQFFSPELEQQLLQLEVAFANRKLSEIRKTRFGIRAVGAGYAFYVLDQTAL